MKCIKCEHDSKKKDRTNGACPQCGEAFAFDPTAGEPSDMAFQKWIERVSGEGRVKFTTKQLYYEVRRRSWGALPGKRTARNLWLGAIVAVVVGTIALAPLTGCVSLIGTLIAGFTLLVVYGSPPPGVMGPDEFGRLYQKWVSAHGAPAALAKPPRENANRRVDPAELESYSFDRAVITDNDDIVDVLIANRFHFENNCAILSVRGHPRAAFDQVRRMLRNNPRIEIYALHDATAKGCTLAHTLRTDEAWFLGIGRVFDVGLRPAHARFFGYAVLENDHAIEPHPGRTPAEDAWLQKHYIELAAIRPEQLIKRLYRAMNNQPEDDTSLLSADGGGVWIGDVSLFGSDAGASDGGADSFG